MDTVHGAVGIVSNLRCYCVAYSHSAIARKHFFHGEVTTLINN